MANNGGKLKQKEEENNALRTTLSEKTQQLQAALTAKTEEAKNPQASLDGIVKESSQNCQAVQEKYEKLEATLQKVNEQKLKAEDKAGESEKQKEALKAELQRAVDLGLQMQVKLDMLQMDLDDTKSMAEGLTEQLSLKTQALNDFKAGLQEKERALQESQMQLKKTGQELAESTECMASLEVEVREMKSKFKEQERMLQAKLSWLKIGLQSAEQPASRCKPCNRKCRKKRRQR